MPVRYWKTVPNSLSGPGASRCQWKDGLRKEGSHNKDWEFGPQQGSGGAHDDYSNKHCLFPPLPLYTGGVVILHLFYHFTIQLLTIR